MPIEFQCVSCGKLLRVGDAAAGKKARCPDCGTIQEVMAGERAGILLPPPEPLPYPAISEKVSPFAPGRAEAAGNPFAEAGAPGSRPVPVGRPVDENPYASPTGAGPAPGPTGPMSRFQARLIAADKVKGPAWGMLILNALALVFSLLSLLIAAFQMLFQQRAANGALLFGYNLIPLAVQLLIVWGAWHMLNLRHYGWALAASILSLIPCSGCCFLGLPFGIWALIVLNDSQVKAGFEG